MAIDPVLLSTLYNPQGAWTGLGPEPTGVSAPEGQETWFTPGEQIKAPHTTGQAIPLSSMQWSDMVRFGYDPHTRTYPGEGTYRPGTVSYRDIPTPETPAPLMQGLFPTVPATTPATTPSGITSLDPNLPLPYYGYNAPTALNVYPGYGNYDPTQSALDVLAPGSTLLRQGQSFYQPGITDFLQREIERLRGGLT